MHQQSGRNLTEEARTLEDSGDIRYTSPAGLVYTKSKRVKIRIAHIQVHLNDSTIKPVHTFFKTGTAVHNDIIRFIDEIFNEFQNNNIDVSSQDRTEDADVGNITLGGNLYQVIDNYNGNEHTYTIIPLANQATPYPIIGTNGGTHGDGGNLYGYCLKLAVKGSDILINTLFPC
ncbi:hypothetical protein [Candidatus Amoebophilus asiaticus]|uniref:hypothetical protein n=1 Tax=Candidatus Amoebophilus asiaticus TaxID=281120 RepID=UPI0002EAFDB5|nr:hypothetical protein [Candidatus Amoebophilus asiaticus]